MVTAPYLVSPVQKRNTGRGGLFLHNIYKMLMRLKKGSVERTLQICYNKL